MRKYLSIAVILLVAGVLTARSGMQGTPQTKKEEMKIIDLKSDLSGPIAKGDTVIFLVGNFAAQHNGAVITCDSAVRYSDKRIEFFGNVLINKNTTYVYGERADYNGELNEARVYSDLVKVVDEDATLYTYEFVFNTKENIGYFGGGGVMTNRDNRLESVRGYYYADAKELICVDQVEMRNDEYEMRGDSVIYNMSSDNAHFFERTNLWSKDGDYLYADRGAYRKADSLYIVTRNGYVLTEKQEMWSDSIDFYRAKNHVILRNDLQIDDTEHKVLSFGDYGEYWKTPGDAFLTRRPSMVSYDLSQGGDSLFMRADSMFLYTLRTSDLLEQMKRAALDSAAMDDTTANIGTQTDNKPTTLGAPDNAMSNASTPTTTTQPTPTTSSDDATTETPTTTADSLRGAGSLQGADSLRGTDSLQGADSVAKLTPAQIKKQIKEAARKVVAEKRAAEAKIKKAKLDKIGAERRQKTTAKLKEQKQREEKRLTAQRIKAESKLQARRLRAQRKGRQYIADSTVLYEIDALLARNAREQDSLMRSAADTTAIDSLAGRDSLDSLTTPLDSIYRLIKGFRNVKMFRRDFQTVCDSMTAISTDSTIHLYINPVLWNENNQITSDVMDIFTKNQQLTRAEFIGSPMMASQIDTTHYNQVAGKTMTALFRDNNIYRNDVNGNALTIYYMQDGEPPQVVMMGVIESGAISFYIDDKQVVQITYRNNPVYDFYPMDKIPIDQDMYLKGFKWQSNRRPTQAEIFNRRIRPSLRTEKSALPRPKFPIMMSVDDHRKRLKEQRRWADRNDKVDPATVDWMRELGFEVGKPHEGGMRP